MKITGYEFTKSAAFQPGATADARIIGAHLEKLRKQHKGDLTPQHVLEDAKRAKSPLHSFFEWDDTAAAEQYRLSQATGLIRSVVAIYKQEDAVTTKTAAANVSHQPSAEVHALSQTATYDAVLRRAVRELAAWRRRYESLTELAPVFAVADLVEKSLAEEAKDAA